MMRPVVLLGSLLPVVVLHGQVTATGSMRATKWEGQLAGLVSMDSLALPGVYGIGPLEYLQGEILLLDGVCHVATVARDGSVQMEQRNDVAAPFFVHARVEHWEEVELPENVHDLTMLNGYLDMLSVHRDEPFVFRLTGRILSAVIHVMDVPPLASVSSPEDAHTHQRNFTVQDTDVRMLGFFSRHHQGVFTHHDSNIHVHLITMDGSLMGHLDRLDFVPASLRLEMAAP